MLRCGIDLLDIQRVRDGIARLGDQYLNRFFTPAERAACADKPHRLAARIAAKEAVSKALGTGIGDVSWQEIEILNSERGRPILVLHGAAQRLSDALGITEWDLSLTHTDTTVAAMAVAR
jgi:holo-[acyl-carrier protein] synthase